MAIDVLQQLAEVEVPPPPEDFSRQVHQRLNLSLLLGHLGDLAVRGMPYALVCFARAVANLVIFHFSGRFEPDRRPGGGGHDAEDRPERA